MSRDMKDAKKSMENFIHFWFAHPKENLIITEHRYDEM